MEPGSQGGCKNACPNSWMLAMNIIIGAIAKICANILPVHTDILKLAFPPAFEGVVRWLKLFFLFLCIFRIAAKYDFCIGFICGDKKTLQNSLHKKEAF